MPITDTDLVRCAERELQFRRKVYPRQVAKGKMSQAEANHELACMAALRELAREQITPSLL